MKRHFSAAALAVLGSLVFCHPSLAQQQGTQQPPVAPPLSFPLWKAELPGGNYVIARNSINAVSSQQYILNGVARVTEVNISTAGIFQPRFYYLEMLDVQGVTSAVPGGSTAQMAAQQVQDAVKDKADSAVPTDQPWMKVVKDYPTTTHAGTIEYRLDTKEQLMALYKSVERTWLTGKSEIFTPEGVRPFNATEELKNKDADSSKSGEGGPGSGGESGGGN